MVLRKGCALSMAERNIVVFTVGGISTLAVEALSKWLCSLNGRKENVCTHSE